MCPPVSKLCGEIKKIYALSALFHIPHMCGKVTDECSAPQMIPMILREHVFEKTDFTINIPQGDIYSCSRN